MSAKIKDVAVKAGVSTATVSHVINNTRYVSEPIKVRVFEAMEELQFMPNIIARSLRCRKSQIIGLIVPIKSNDNANNFFLSVANGIESVLKRYGYHLLLSNSQEDHKEEMERIKIFNNQFIDGLIIAPTSGIENHSKETIFGDYPVVFIDRKPRLIQGDSVLINGTKGTYNGIKALMEKGHRKIGFIAGLMGITTTEERLVGYRQALMEFGIPVKETLIKTGDMSWQTGYLLAEELLKERDITALFVANNAMSLGVLRFLQERKIRIPQEVALIGFDDYEWTEVATPSLSVVKQPSYELGVKAAEILLNRIENPMISNREILLDSELIIRNSV